MKPQNPKGRVIDLVLPVLVLIITCTIGMLYVGGFFGADPSGSTEFAGDFIGAFGNTNAFVGLPWGGIISPRSHRYLPCRARCHQLQGRDVLRPQGLHRHGSPIIILTLAVSLKTMTSNLGAAEFVRDLVYGASSGLTAMPRGHLRRGLHPRFRVRHLLGHIRHPHPHHDRDFPHLQRAADNRHLRLFARALSAATTAPPFPTRPCLLLKKSPRMLYNIAVWR